MSRALRIEFPGAVYHVMARGQRREIIFRNEADRSDFLELLGKACQRYGWKVYGYVLMGNHYHLVLETFQANLSQGMHWLQTSFSTRHRLRHGLSGVVFGGRYKALLIERDGLHLGTVLDYIHLNPWRAGLATLSAGLEIYPWSSLIYYVVAPKNRPVWVDVEGGLSSQELRDTAGGRRRFLKALEERASGEAGLPDEVRSVEMDWLAQLRRGWCFGSQSFREALLKEAGRKLAATPHAQGVDGQIRKDVSQNRARQLIRDGCAAWEIELGELRQRAKGDSQKVVLGWVVREQTAVSLSWLSETLNLGAPAAACRLLGRLKEKRLQTKQEKQWLMMLKRISI